MSEITWIKLKTDVFEDEKIRLIENMPNRDTILVIWFKLLAQAGKSNLNGYLMLNENVPLNTEELSALFNRPLNDIRLAFTVLERYQMIEVDAENEIISIRNWGKHQNIEGMDKVRLQTKERNRKYRERKRQNLLLEDDVSVTSRDATDKEEDIEIDIEKDKKKEKEEQLKNDFESFYSIYPKKVDRKKAFDAYKACVTNSKKHERKYTPDEIKNGTTLYARYCQHENTEKRFIKNPATFLNQESFLNDYTLEDKAPTRNYNNFKQAGRKELLPNWFDKDEVLPPQPKEPEQTKSQEELDREVAEMKRKLKEGR
ncbi:replication protein [Listeria booriae]|uniref:Replication protein n=1 Tax=Listeria booriae TaxID=1552123 RepID=A0A842CR57_9LIST|nr:phage replisome organizer N-terminal domain-containing protein [Listeria booriae]MBC2004668.1 replication protein [Listeria booriae]